MTDFPTAAKRIVEDYLRHEPVQATMSGLHDYDAELPDLTVDGFNAAALRAKAYVASLEHFAPEHLTADERIDRTLLHSHFSGAVHEHEARQPHKHEPSTYIDQAIVGVYSLLMHDFAPITDRVPAIDARLKGIPSLLAAGKANLERAPAIWTEIAQDEALGGVEFLQTDVAPLCKEHPQLSDPLTKAIEAFEDYGAFLRDDLAAKDGMPFSLGRELFDYRLKHEHLLPFDVDSLLAFGERAVESTRQALAETARRIDANKPWTEIVEQLRTDHPSAGDLIDAYRRSVDDAKRFVAERGLLTMPKDDVLDVVETPVFMRPTIPYAAYMPPGPYEARQRGQYYVTPVNEKLRPEERAEQLLGHNRFAMLLTNVHEAYPGHHVQLVKANHEPSLVRKIFESTVLIEGWALYCEQLVLDEGMTDDPRTRLFQLKDQLWRACRVVIDVMLHTGRMTFDEAVDMLVNTAHLERPNAAGEVRRYTQAPTQPMSYLTGKQQIMDLRERERTRLGARFDLKDFHDRLLGCGSIPVSLIESSFGETP